MTEDIAEAIKEMGGWNEAALLDRIVVWDRWIEKGIAPEGTKEARDAAMQIIIQRVERLRAERDEAIQRGDDWCDQAKKLRAERDRLRAGLLRALQYENKCDQTGQPCDASDRCACSLEAETWCDGDGA